MSRTTINYKSEPGVLQITIKMFIDDLESGLALEGHNELKLCTEKEKEGADDLVAQYIYNRLSISDHGNALEYVYLGKEISEDLSSVWCYLELENLQEPKTLHVDNKIMLELFKDQKNMVMLQKDSKRIDNELFDNETTSFTFEF